MSPTATRPRPREQALTELGTALKAVLVAIRRLRGRETHRPGELSFAQLQLLHCLADRDELTTGELAVAADLAPASVSQMLDHLEAAGFVQRSRSRSDRRVVDCALTPAGRELVAERLAHQQARWREVLAGFTTAELATATAVLARVGEHFASLDTLPGAGR